MKKYIIFTYILLLFTSTVYSKSAIQNITYKGWIDSYKITSDEYSLVIVPEIGGRIMEYSKNSVNILWQNDEFFGLTFPIADEWRNYGGFQLWPSPQKLWGWPPDPMIDYAKTNCEILSSNNVQSLKITGAPNLEMGIVSTKEISMSDIGEVTIISKIHNISGKTISYGIWNVTYVDIPSIIAFPINPSSKFQNGILYFTDKSKQSKQFNITNGICTVDYLGEDGLIGSDTNGRWMANFINDLVYIKTVDPIIKNSNYPNNGCTMQILTSSSLYKYMEMETFSPIVSVKPGDYISHKEVWMIRKLTQPVTDKKGVIKAVNGMKGKMWIP